MTKKDVTGTIGNTPLVRLARLEQVLGLEGNLYAKLESTNPGGSIKDRVALAMVDDAEKKGLLKEGGTLIEPTSGNTGVGLALIASARQYKAILVMPDSMSVERRKLLYFLGAELVLTPGSEGMPGAIAKAKELHEETPNSIIPQQFENPVVEQIHYDTTGPEIFEQMDGKVDYFVAGVGTGGTVSGASRFLKEKLASVITVAVEPSASAILSGGKKGPHKIQGIGAGFVPGNYHKEVVDQVLSVTDADSMDMQKLLAKTEGVLAGISSGAALAAAVELAKKAETKDKNIIVVLPDTGERYLSNMSF